MNKVANKPEELLFSDLEGNRVQYEDVIDEGLDGGYEERIPALIELLVSGEPYYQLLSCGMLTSWGHPSGFKKLIEWASNPGKAPWNETPVDIDRFTGADSAFELLAEALETSSYCDDEPELLKWQISAIKALTGIYHQSYFDRTLALAIINCKIDIEEVHSEIISAIKASLDRLERKDKIDFDLSFQIASLLMPLVRIDEQAAADYANLLLANYPDNTRMLMELSNALAKGTKSSTYKILENMMKLSNPMLKKEVEKALSRRK